MKIKEVNLETVCGVTSKLPKNLHPEVAFCGRSNVGKSSLINTVLNRKNFAHTSSKPGKTQTINFYHINNAIYLVDLPGYGYAQTSRTEAAKWGDMIERYLTGSEMLRCIFLLVDIRHDPSVQDRQMFEWILYLGIQPIVVCTKSDKLNKSQIENHMKNIRTKLGADDDVIMVPFSSLKNEGAEDILDFMDQVIENEE